MTDEQLAAMHSLLAEYHRNLAKEAVLDVQRQYHADLAQRFADEAALIPRRRAILERLHEREQQQRMMTTSTNDVDAHDVLHYSASSATALKMPESQSYFACVGRGGADLLP